MGKIKNKLSYFRKKADRAMQDYFTQKYPNCEMCNAPVSCMHHFHPKSVSSALRYVEENLVPVCNSCHLGFHSNRSAQMTSRLIDKRGVEWSNDLLKRKEQIVKPSIGYYKEIVEKYT